MARPNLAHGVTPLSGGRHSVGKCAESSARVKSKRPPPILPHVGPAPQGDQDFVHAASVTNPSTSDVNHLPFHQPASAHHARGTNNALGTNVAVYGAGSLVPATQRQMFWVFVLGYSAEPLATSFRTDMHGDKH